MIKTCLLPKRESQLYTLIKYFSHVVITRFEINMYGLSGVTCFGPVIAKR